MISALTIHTPTQPRPVHLRWMRATDAKAWRMVENHTDNVIVPIVRMAIAKGFVPRQDRNIALSDARYDAFKLVRRYDPARGPFDRYLTKTLWLNIRRTATRRRRDRVPIGPGWIQKTGVKPSRAAATPAEIAQRIEDRLPARIRAIARVALLDRLSLAKISHRTGRRGPGPKAELRKIIRFCQRRVELDKK